MGLKLKRKKPRNIKLSLAYKIFKFWPLGPRKKLKLFLDLAWIFNRLAHEQTFKAGINIEYAPEDDFLVNKVPEQARVLDIGCGAGYVIKRLLFKTNQITGVDYDQPSIDAAKSNIKDNGVTFICDDVFNYLKENPKKEFDVIILSHVLEHIDQPLEFLKKIADQATYFYIEVPDFEANHLNLYRQRIGTDLVYTDADHVSEFDRDELNTIIKQVNLDIIDSSFSFGVMRYWIKSKR